MVKDARGSDGTSRFDDRARRGRNQVLQADRSASASLPEETGGLDPDAWAAANARVPRSGSGFRDGSDSDAWAAAKALDSYNRVVMLTMALLHGGKQNHQQIGGNFGQQNDGSWGQ